LWIVSALPAWGIVLDWSAVSWPVGSLSQSFDIDPANPGNDVTITVTGNTGDLVASPAVSTTSVSGAQNTGGTGLPGLQLGVDYDGGSTPAITVTMTFNYTGGVNASFSLWDVDTDDSEVGTVDTSKTVDEIGAVSGTDPGGATIAASSVSAGAAITIAGSGIAATYTGANATADSPQSTLGISFDEAGVTTIQFTYEKGTSANAGNQWIALSNITFSSATTPEVQPSLAALIACLGAAVWNHRSRRAKKPGPPGGDPVNSH
jgi:hypothetical protein